MTTPNSLFGLVPAGQPCITTPTSNPSAGSFIFAVPVANPQKPFSHLAVFLLPGVPLPQNTAAAIYVATNANPAESDFKFVGAVGQGKESSILKIGIPAGTQGVVVGIAIEPADGVLQRMNGLTTSSQNKDLVVAPPSTLVLAQRIIRNAFNFLSSFSGQAGQVEVVPLKAFEEWWKKFEAKVKNDPTFLERATD